MPNDAKLGLFLGISLVVVIGLVFFRAGPAANGSGGPPTTSVNSNLVTPPVESSPQSSYSN
jgi:hypothetical protein